jgi:hypothetical protein
MFVKIVIPKLIFAAAVLSAALCFNMPTAHAGLYGDSRWCDVTNWNCQFDTVEECRPTLFAGNHGFCSQNPYWHPDPTASGARLDPTTSGAPNGSKAAH